MAVTQWLNDVKSSMPVFDAEVKKCTLRVWTCALQAHLRTALPSPERQTSLTGDVVTASKITLGQGFKILWGLAKDGHTLCIPENLHCTPSNQCQVNAAVEAWRAREHALQARAARS